MLIFYFTIIHFIGVSSICYKECQQDYLSCRHLLWSDQDSLWWRELFQCSFRMTVKLILAAVLRMILAARQKPIHFIQKALAHLKTIILSPVHYIAEEVKCYKGCWVHMAIEACQRCPLYGQILCNTVGIRLVQYQPYQCALIHYSSVQCTRCTALHSCCAVHLFHWCVLQFIIVQYSMLLQCSVVCTAVQCAVQCSVQCSVMCSSVYCAVQCSVQCTGRPVLRVQPPLLSLGPYLQAQHCSAAYSTTLHYTPIVLHCTALHHIIPQCNSLQ